MNTLATRSIRLAKPELSMVIAVVIAGVFIIYFETLQSIVAIWNRSETYAHGYIIVPVSLWLIWRRRDTLAAIHPRPFWPGLIALMACGAAWMLADLAGVHVVRQYAFVAMLPFAVLTVLGTGIARAMLFPLLFLLLAVPFGEAFVDPLVDFTADFTVTALQVTGIPVLRNGNSFEIPTGNWSVVEACSGVRYLISSFTLGCLYAYLTYRSVRRRLAFIGLSVLVPIIANGLRAYLIVLLGHFSGNKLAAGVDHLIYGWLFFGLVMLLMFWIGSFWSEDTVAHSDSAPKNKGDAQHSVEPIRPVALAAAAALVCLAIWPLYAAILDQALPAPRTGLDEVEVKWTPVPAFTEWRPAFQPADNEDYRYYTRNADLIGVAVLSYSGEKNKPQLISSTNRLLTDDSPWRQIEASFIQVKFAGEQIDLRETVISNGERKLQVWYAYVIDGKLTTNDYAGKLRQAKMKLLMRGSGGSALFIVTPYGASQTEGRELLQQFLDENPKWIRGLTDRVEGR